MKTEIRLIFRHGASVTLPFDGTFADFCLMLRGSSGARIVAFGHFCINLDELACAYAYGERAPEPTAIKSGTAV